jgi:hypothetical protein
VKPSKRLFIGASAAVVIVIAVVAYLMWPISIEKVAQLTLQAAREGDGGTLHRFSFESEVDAAGLTPALLDKVWQISVLPRLEGYREASPPTVEANADRSQAIARVVLRNQDGNELELLSAPFASDEGPRMSPMNFVTAMWTQEYVVEKGKPVTTLSVLEARMEGVRNDRAQLEAAGLKGFPSRNGDGSFYPWDEAIASWQRTLDAAKSRAQSQ